MNMDNALEEAKRKIDLKEYVIRTAGGKEILRGKDKDGEYIRIDPCPFCGHKGHFDVYVDTNSYCSRSGCCKGGTIIDFIIEYDKLSLAEAIKKVKEITEMNDLPIKRTMPLAENQGDKKTSQKRTYDFTYVSEELHKNIGQTDYFKARGLSETIIEKYKLGYHKDGLNYVNDIAKDALLEKKNDLYKTYQYFIPCFNSKNECYYILSRRNDNIPTPTWVKSKIHKVHNLKSYAIPIFNSRYVEVPSPNDRFIFVVEGWADALSLEELGYKAMSINSANNVKAFIDLVKKNKDLVMDKVFILAGDADSAGQGMNLKLKNGLQALKNIKFDTFIISQFKDLNDWLIADRAGMEHFFKDFLHPLETKVTSVIPKEIEENPKVNTKEKIKEFLLKMDFSDEGLGNFCAEKLKDKVKYLDDKDTYKMFNGKLWEDTTDKRVKMVIQQSFIALRKAYGEVRLELEDEERSALDKKIRKLSTKTYFENANYFMKINEKILLSNKEYEDQFNKNPFVINCQNGELNLKTLELSKHNPGSKIDMISGANFKKSFHCPNFLGELKRMYEKDELIDYLIDAIAVSLLGYNFQQVALFLGGAAGSGKSTIEELIGDIFGSYGTELNKNSLLKTSTDKVRNDLLCLNGKRMVFSTEFSSKDDVDVPLFKSILGGKVKTRALHSNFYEEFKPHCTLFLTTNEMPNLEDTSGGIERRLHYLNTGAVIDKSKVKGNFYEENLKPEIDDVFSMLAARCNEIITNKREFAVPDEVVAASRAMRELADETGILAFINHCILRNEDEKIRLLELRDLYKMWTEVENIPKWYESDKKLSNELANRLRANGFNVRTGAKNYVYVFDSVINEIAKKDILSSKEEKDKNRYTGWPNKYSRK